MKHDLGSIRQAWARVAQGRRRLAATLSDPASLGRRAMGSGLWRAGGHGFSQVLRLGSNLIMTRLLAPEDFGLMAIGLTIQTGLLLATDMGVNLSVIRSDRGEDSRFLRAAWTFKLIKQTCVAAIVALAGLALWALQGAADLGDTVYADPRAPLVIALLGLPMVLRGAESVNLALGERRMSLSRVILTEIAAQVIGLGAMIGFALVEPSVWALVFGVLVGAVARCLMTHTLLPGPRMGLCFDREHFVELWRFGKWLAGASIFGFVGRNGDRLILGALLNPLDFAIYAIARLWIDAASLAVEKVYRPVSYAVLGEVRRDRPKALKRTFDRIRMIQNAICVGSFLVMLLLGETVITTLYTAEYHGVGATLALLAPMLLVRVFAPFGTLLINAGDSRQFAWVTFVQAAALCVLLPTVFHLFGPVWAVFVVAVNQVWGAPRQIVLARRVVAFDVRREFALLALVVAVSVGVTLAFAPPA